ncbi:MAG: hypothetical protein IPO32_10405 [Crocinitomicaceae bacterium]|nr:hypothetical protein [Crocinitomicaceae bacterium]
MKVSISNPLFVLTLSLLLLSIVSCKKKGCTNEYAINYNSSAEKSDGSCILGNWVLIHDVKIHEDGIDSVILYNGRNTKWNFSECFIGFSTEDSTNIYAYQFPISIESVVYSHEELILTSDSLGFEVSTSGDMNLYLVDASGNYLDNWPYHNL